MSNTRAKTSGKRRGSDDGSAVFKYEYLGDSVGVQAWIKFAILPGVYAGEMGLKGFWGIAIKKMLQARVNEMEYAIANPNPQPQASANV